MNEFQSKIAKQYGIQTDITSAYYAAPMFAKAAMSLIPDTVAETAFIGVAGVVTKPLLFVGTAAAKPLLFAGNKAFNYGAKTLGYTGTTSGSKLAYGAAAEGVAGARGAGVSVSKNELIFSKKVSIDFAPTGYLDGDLYPSHKLRQLYEYLHKRGADIQPPPLGAKGVGFCASDVNTGMPTLYLWNNPTVLQVKHELSHYLDYKKLGFEKYNLLSTLEKEQMVLQRLQNKERFWEQLNFKEKEFSIDYVEGIANNVKIKNANELKSAGVTKNVVKN